MDCATLCLLAISVGLTPSPQTQRCTYCMDVRGMTSICDEDPMKCASTDPDSVIYCLTVNEFVTNGQVRRIVRCLSHKHFNLSSEAMIRALTNAECFFDSMQTCDCPTCALPATSTWSTPSVSEESEEDFSGEFSPARLQSNDLTDSSGGNQRLPSSHSKVNQLRHDKTSLISASSCNSINYFSVFLLLWILRHVFNQHL